MFYLNKDPFNQQPFVEKLMGWGLEVGVCTSQVNCRFLFIIFISVQYLNKTDQLIDFVLDLIDKSFLHTFSLVEMS